MLSSLLNMSDSIDSNYYYVKYDMRKLVLHATYSYGFFIYFLTVYIISLRHDNKECILMLHYLS